MRFDSATEDRLSLVYPDLKTRWIRLANDLFNLHGLTLRVAQGMRTYADQLEIYKIGRVLVDGRWMPEQPTDPYPHGKVVTWSKPGESWHHYSAIDSCFVGSDPWLDHCPQAEFYWSEYARLAVVAGFESGFYWPTPRRDLPHIQLRYGGMTMLQTKDLFARGKLNAVWARFDQIRGIRVGSEWSDPVLLQRLCQLGMMD